MGKSCPVRAGAWPPRPGGRMPRNPLKSKAPAAILARRGVTVDGIGGGFPATRGLTRAYCGMMLIRSCNMLSVVVITLAAAE
jgi:hypothetical protein